MPRTPMVILEVLFDVIRLDTAGEKLLSVLQLSSSLSKLSVSSLMIQSLSSSFKEPSPCSTKGTRTSP